MIHAYMRTYTFNIHNAYMHVLADNINMRILNHIHTHAYTSSDTCAHTHTHSLTHSRKNINMLIFTQIFMFL